MNLTISEILKDENIHLMFYGQINHLRSFKILCENIYLFNLLESISKITCFLSLHILNQNLN